MPIFKFFSKVRSNDANDDLSSVVQNKQELAKSTELFKKLSKDEFLIIASFLQISDLGNFARCNQQFLELLFNLNIEKINLITKRKKEFSDKDMPSRIVSIKDVYNENDESFDATQKLIWKPLVLHYFTNYSNALNVKNWMHILRRRVIHLQTHSSSSLPLSKPQKIGKDYNREFIENCGWEYLCPLKIDSLEVKGPGTFYCNVCKENIYKAYNQLELENHTKQNHCVIWVRDDRKNNYGPPIGKRLPPPTIPNKQ